MKSNQKQLDLIRKSLQSMTQEEKSEWIKGLEAEEWLFLYRNPDVFLFEKQIIPDSGFVYFLLQCGRGFGKSYAGSAWIAKKVRSGAKIIGLCGPTYDDVAKVMVPAIISWFMPHELHTTPFNKLDHTIQFANGAKIYCYTSEKEVRGPNLEYLWCDEICNWCDGISAKIETRFEDITRAVRVGRNPQTLITSTPKSHKFFWDFQDQIDKGNTDYQLRRGTMFDNPHLTQSFLQAQLKKYGNSNRARQELYGELITENPEAVFSQSWIDNGRYTVKEEDGSVSRNHDLTIKTFFEQVLKGEISIQRMVISVDPSGSAKDSSDETGIVLIAKSYSKELYVLYDKSGRYSPDEWARIVRNLYRQYSRIAPTLIVAETNFGGDMVVSNLLALDTSLKPFIKEIKASKSKTVRAEVSAAKYERGKIHHVGFFDKLERQMTNYTGPDANYSPDRMDALVHGINELLVVPQYSKRDTSILKMF